MSQTPTIDRASLERELETHRRVLLGYCYRMLGSPYEAEDAVQETMMRAWRALDGFDGRSSVSTWLYRIATNVCLDQLHGRRRRAIPMDLSPAATAEQPLADPVSWDRWVQPVPDALVVPADTADPGELVEARETIRLAFVAALQELPPKQRAVLILREVLKWQATEVAELLGTTVAGVNSAMQRARATLDARRVEGHRWLDPTDDAQRDLLERYVDAFERYDIDAFVKLLHDDATHTMPPYEMWLRGPEQIGRWMLTTGITCKGARLLPTTANGAPAFGLYRATGPGGKHEPFNVHVLDVSDGRVAGITYFLDIELFPLFELPTEID